VQEVGPREPKESVSNGTGRGIRHVNDLNWVTAKEIWAFTQIAVDASSGTGATSLFRLG
jgi:hypothetical protein